MRMAFAMRFLYVEHQSVIRFFFHFSAVCGIILVSMYLRR